MEEQKKRRAAGEDGEAGDLYELDLDQHNPGDLDAAIRDAVDAVKRAGGGAGERGRAGATNSEKSGESEMTEEQQDVAAEALAECEQLRAEAASLKERLVRTLADFENYRKRTDREKQALGRTAIAAVVREFLGVFDNLERALEASGGVDDLKQGLRMVLRQQEEVLRRHGVVKVDAIGQPFDPALHEAVVREESAEVKVPTVTAEMQKGYLLDDRLLRPAMVNVAVPAAAAANAAAADADAGEDEETELAAPAADGETEEVASRAE